MATYRYSADGTKVSVQYASGEGLFYMGSMVFKTAPGKNPELETIAFAGGQLVMADTPTGKRRIPQYHIKDHLGSVRAVVENGTLVEKINYYPFGKKWQTDGALSTNDHLFNGKQQQHWTEQAGILDYGARFYDPQIAQWQTQDPMAEKYINISPYTYCANNPIKYIDPTGMKIEDGSKKEWKKYKGLISEMRANLKRLRSGAGIDLFTQDLDERIKSLGQTLEDMSLIERSTQIFGLRYNSDPTKPGGLRLEQNPETKIYTVGIHYGTKGNFVHEVIHAGQVVTGDIALSLNDNAKIIAQDIFDEHRAYTGQYAFDAGSVSLLAPGITYMSDITTEWIQGLVDSKGNKLYTPEGPGHMGLLPVNINTKGDILMKAYPGEVFPPDQSLKEIAKELIYNLP